MSDSVAEPVTVVVAEDEAIIRMDLIEVLREEGYDVVADCGRGDDAVQLVGEHQPDLALLDIKMPGMTGIDAAREITSASDTAVVMLTAFSQRDLIHEASDAGAMAYLVKPYQREDLVPAVELAIARRREAAALRSELSAVEQRFEERKIIDRAKGNLIDAHGLSEADAFQFLQRSAMSSRRRMIDVAHDVLAGAVTPEGG
ncbi:MAG: response regulator [Actinomycetota bacterium]